MPEREGIRQAAEPQFAAFLAIDWADEKHAWILQVAGSERRESGELEHKVETVEAWVAQLCQGFGNRPIAIAVEQTKGALVYMLAKYECLYLFPVPSTMAAAMREALYPSGAKDDPRDADLLLDLLLQYRKKLHQLSPDNEATRKVQNLVEERRKLVDEKTAQCNRLTSYLKIYFPQMLEWFENLDTKLVCELLSRWPTLEELQQASPEELRTFFHQQHCRNRELIERRIQGIHQAKPAIADRAVIEAKRTVVKVIVQLISSLLEGIAELDGKIAEAAAAHPDFFIFASLPGAGEVMAPRVLAAFGSQRIVMLARTSCKPIAGRAYHRAEWEEKVGAFPLGLSQVSATGFSRMGGSFDHEIGVGACLLPATAKGRPWPSCRGACPGVQMDSRRIPLLERPGRL
jgi:hypothetical protein